MHLKKLPLKATSRAALTLEESGIKSGARSREQGEEGHLLKRQRGAVFSVGKARLGEHPLGCKFEFQSPQLLMRLSLGEKTLIDKQLNK